MASSIFPNRSVVFAVMMTVAIGCAQDDPESRLPSMENGEEEACAPDEGLGLLYNPECVPLPGDYRPQDTENDGWAPCISDDGIYHSIEPNISSVARIGAFEEIANLLAFDGSRVPTAEDFLKARVVYTQEEGLESRVVRREDEHVPPLATSCRELSEAEQLQHADRCVGPARIRPLLNEAFLQGSQGQDRVRNAARIEAGLLWFFYVSTHKEAVTCANTPKDCDSSYAYYTGGEPRASGLGLARYVRFRSEQSHNRIWDGILALRCWRDLDNPTGPSQDGEMHRRAVEQLDRALNHGLAVIVRQRLDNLACRSAWETVQILGKVLIHEANRRDPEKADRLQSRISSENAADVEVDEAKALIDELFPCP